jgi:DNA polymerase-4
MILHVDMDAFYASIEERDRPELIGKPVIVGGTPEGRGVVAAANYVARQYGIHSAMAAVTARRLCPQAICLPPRMQYYAEVSKQIHEIFQRFTPIIEPLSLDEAFLDVRGSEQLFGSSAAIGRRIKADIRQQLRLVASVGVAPVKFVAKIASDLQKPDGFVVVDAKRVQEFLDPLPVSRLWGVGRVAGEVFRKLGIRTIGQLRKLPAVVLVDHFGQSGEHLWRLAHGLDERQVVPDHQTKSISTETTFAADIQDLEILRAWLIELTDQVASRLRRQGVRGRTVQLKIRFADFKTITRSETLPAPTNTTYEIAEAARQILDTRLPADHLDVRLLGVEVSGFEHSDQSQRLLFDQSEHQKQKQLDAAIDQITDRFGKATLRRASGLRGADQHQRE